MYLILLFVIVLVVALILYGRDRRYLSRELKDVVSEEMKNRLNIKTPDDDFMQKINKTSGTSRASKKILEHLKDE